MRLPNLNALRMFDAAARHLNFRLAAEELHVTQGAVAQQVRGLEADLATPLFIRQPRGLALTEAGRRYHRPVSRALAMIAEATADLRPQPARVTLTLTPSFAAKWLLPRMAKFEAQHPDIDLQIVATEACVPLGTGGADIAIRWGPDPASATLDSHFLGPLNLCAVASPEVAARIGPVTSPADLIGEKLIQDGHSHWEALLDGETPTRRIMRFNQTALAMDAAANGQGIALVAELLLQDQVTAGRLAILWRDPGNTQGAYYLATPKAGRARPAVQAVCAWVKGEVG